MRIGIDAFRQGEYAVARDAFARAYDAGLRTPKLLYNLGSSEFKLGHFSAAAAYFERIVRDPTWGALAQYNLGLIDDARDRPEQAQRHYRAAYDGAESDKLRQIAAAKLTATPPSRVDVGWYGIASTGAGYDDNVVLLNDQNLVGVSNQGDAFAEVLGSASHFLAGDFEDGWRADLSGYYRGYRDQHDFDYGDATVGLMYGHTSGSAQWQVGGRVGEQFVGGNAYTTTGTIRAQARWQMTNLALRVRNDSSFVQGADHFGYLTGWRNRAGIDFERHVAGWPVYLGYDFELNDRRDYASATEAASYSPTVQRVYADATWPWSDALDADAHVEYQSSDYAHEDVQLQSNGTVKTDARNDSRFYASLRVAYHPAPEWNVFLEYAYTHNASNFDSYEYSDHQYMVGVERPF